MFVSHGDDYILNIIYEVQIHEEVEAGHVLYTWVWSHFQPGPPNREVPTLTPRIDSMKYKSDLLGGRQDIIIMHEILRGRLLVVINCYYLTTKCENISPRRSYPMTA